MKKQLTSAFFTKNLLFLFFAIAPLTTVMASEKENYTITVTMPSNHEYAGKYAYLAIMNDDLDTYRYIDSTQITGNSFAFTGEASGTVDGRHIFIGDKYNKKRDKGSRVNLIFVPEAGDIKMDLDDYYVPELTGAPLNSKLSKMLILTNGTMKRIQELRETVPKNNSAAIQNARVEIAKLNTKTGNEVNSYLKQINGKPLFDELYIIYGGYLLRDQANALVKKKSERLTAYFDKMASDMRKRGKSRIGKPFIELRCINNRGLETELSKHVPKGKVVLIDFWASWCSPCIKEIPNMKRLYNQYKNKGFEIVSISIDKETDKWRTAMRKNEMPWTQLKQGEDTMAKSYGTNVIPHTVLVGADGNVLDKNIWGKDLEKVLKELFK